VYTLRRALLLGIAFGLAAATVGFWLSLLPVLQRGFGPGPAFFARTAPLIIGLGVLLGVATAPLLLLRAGRFVHLLVLGLLWYAMERAVAIDSPLFAPMVVAVPVTAVVLVLLGFLLARWGRIIPWGVGTILFVAGMFAPPMALYLTRPPIEARAELPPAPAGAPDVVLVVLDTVRAGNVSTYGYERPTSPTLDTLAKEGALFLDATSPSTWSLPSHASLFTGRYPSSHGAHAEHRYLDDRYPTLAQALEGNGYETFCLTANPWISDGLGLTRGFGWQDESLLSEGGAGLGFSFIHRLLDRIGLQDTDKGGAAVASSFEEWARERPAQTDRPAFVFLNFIEAHFPYHQLPRDHLYRFTDRPYSALRRISIDLLGAQFGGERPPAAAVREPTVDMYDGGVVYSNELLARVVDALRARGTLDHTVLVVLADHGEVLGERDGFFGHGPTLYQESVGVPLLVRYPPKVAAGTRVETPVSTLGVFATIVDLADLAPPPTLQVGSFTRWMRGESAGPGPILSELHDPSEMGNRRESTDPQMQPGRYRLFREGNLKLVTPSEGDPLLYDLAVDPGETRNLALERPADLRHMQVRLAAVQTELGLREIGAPLVVGDDAPELDAATQESLRALGYVE
jgi:arylsulfatase A-like enzyme